MFKKRLALLTVAALFSGAVLAGCENPFNKKSDSKDGSSQKEDDKGGGEDAKYTVKYYVGTSLYEEVKDVAKGSKIQAPANPTKAEDDDYTYTFDGWYENGATTKWNFNTDTVNKNLELFAKFNSEAKQYDLVVWVWGGTSTVYITPEESADLAQRVRALPAMADKAIRWKYVNNLTNPFFNQAVNEAHVSLVISGAKMDNDTIEDEDASIALDAEGGKTKVAFGWFNSVNRYVGIPAGLGNAEFALAKTIYDMLKENGPYYFTAAIDNSSILLNQTAQVSAKDAENNPITEGLSYSVKDAEIASVNESGVVTGLAVGDTVVSVHYGFAQRDINIGVTDKEVNLKVAVWAQNGSNEYATQAQIDTVSSNFTAFAATKSIEVVARWDYISGGTSVYPDNIGDDVMVVISGPNVMSQCGTTTAYPVVNFTFSRDRYLGIKPGFETNPIVQLLAEYLCQDTITVHFAADLSAPDQEVTYLGGETLVMPTVESTASHIHIGWALTEDATEALFGVDAAIGYAQLKDHAVEGELTLYPVFSNKEINLKVAIWAQNGSNEYATQDQIDTVSANFVAFAAFKSVEVVARWDFVSGKTADYPAAIASDVMVIISGKNVISQCGTLTDYPVIHATFTSQRYLGIVDGYKTNAIVQLLAEYLCQDTITVHFAASLGAADQEITVVGEEAVEFPAVTGIPDDKELKGWAIAEDGEVVFGAAATVKFADLDAVDTAKEVTLYPVIGEKPAVVYDLVIDLLLGKNADNIYITEDDIDLYKAAFDAAIADAGLTNIHYEVRAEFIGTGANFWTRVNGAGDVDVVVGASNLDEQTGYPGVLDGTAKTKVTLTGVSNASRYAYAIPNAGTRGHGTLAQLFLSAVHPA